MLLVLRVFRSAGPGGADAAEETGFRLHCPQACFERTHSACRAPPAERHRQCTAASIFIRRQNVWVKHPTGACRGKEAPRLSGTLPEP